MEAAKPKYRVRIFFNYEAALATYNYLSSDYGFAFRVNLVGRGNCYLVISKKTDYEIRERSHPFIKPVIYES